MKTRSAQSIGFALYVLSFWLPALGNPEIPHRTWWGTGSIAGWGCAVLSLLWGFGGLFSPSELTEEGRKVFHSLLLPGLTNPLLIAHIVLLLRRSFLRARQIIAVVVVICIIFSARVPSMLRMTPLIGLYLWAMAILLIVDPDLLTGANDIVGRVAQKSRELPRVVG